MGGFKPEPRTFVGDFENRESRNFIADQNTGWRMRPNIEFVWKIAGERDIYRSNDQGFRSEMNVSRFENRKVIALIGDSFAFGTGVEFEETFGELLGDSLGDDVTVYNLAMPGFGLDQMWMSVRHQALPLEPALIIFAFIDADLDRSQSAYRMAEGFNKPTFELENGNLRPQTRRDKPSVMIRLLEAHSGLWTILRKTIKHIGYRYSFGDWWLRNRAIIKAMNSDAKSADTPLLLVRLPLRQRRTFPSLHRLAKTEDLNLLDLGGPETGSFDNLHFVDDAHINEAGHAFVADRLTQWIKENRLLD
ncbi:MAG: SGNH/GDSL hydrolase family protein [Proteobacteria bacterium]|nr:SGNH/GDSL hydrolase family protein [Pseudomonadota bacterium]